MSQTYFTYRSHKDELVLKMDIFDANLLLCMLNIVVGTNFVARQHSAGHSGQPLPLPRKPPGPSRQQSPSFHD